jgi:16S rRNA (cytosine967-C5)-methyltransferase
MTNKKLPFREHHLLTLLNAYDNQALPLDLFVSIYFREHKALGSKDRGFIAETIYGLIRWRGLLDYLTEKPLTWEKRYAIYSQTDLNEIQKKDDIPLHVRVSSPWSLFGLIESAYGTERAKELCLVNNTPAPTVVRVNTLKTTRKALLDKWKDLYDISPTELSPNGIVFHKKMNFFELAEFKEGLFEVQDEGSQLLANLIQPNPGDLILDYCAGSGGKTLAFAPSTGQKGQIYLHDIRPTALQEARKRLKRAGIQNAQITLASNPGMEKLKKKMDWVLVDAPCTGTGTLRRNPGMKWRFDESALIQVVGQQRTIFEKALSFMHPDGKIVYGTCSILKEENEVQLEHFMKTYGLSVVGNLFQSFPTLNGMDGFFGVVLKRT